MHGILTLFRGAVPNAPGAHLNREVMSALFGRSVRTDQRLSAILCILCSDASSVLSFEFGVTSVSRVIMKAGNCWFLCPTANSLTTRIFTLSWPV